MTSDNALERTIAHFQRFTMNLIIALLLSLSLLAPATAQVPVPIEKEPRHQLKFQNRYVRLFYVSIPPGDTTLFHTHVNDNVGVRLTDAELSDVVPGGKPEKVFVNHGAVGFGHYPGPLTHSVGNVGSTPFHNILVEVLPSTGMPSRGPSLAHAVGHTLVLENDRVQIFRLALAPGQSTEEHSHTVHGVTVVITGGTIAFDVPGTKTETVSFAPGDYRWHAGGMRHSLRNMGSAPFEAVVIELEQHD